MAYNAKGSGRRGGNGCLGSRHTCSDVVSSASEGLDGLEIIV